MLLHVLNTHHINVHTKSLINIFFQQYFILKNIYQNDTFILLLLSIF
jgi:hypothetical protein